MFDFSFAELLLCFVIALVVLGPERLPKVARTVGRWAGQARGYLRNLSAELDRESQLSELKQQLEDAQRLVSDQQRAVRNMLEKYSSDTTKIGSDLVSAVEDDAARTPALAVTQEQPQESVPDAAPQGQENEVKKDVPQP